MHIVNGTITLLKNVSDTKIRSESMEIKRDAYLEQLKLRKDNGMIKIITGAYVKIGLNQEKPYKTRV